MRKVDVIKITKEFEKEDLVNAIKAYMTPKNAKVQLESVCIGKTYVVRLLLNKKKRKPDQGTENCSVKLSFDDENCTVEIFVGNAGLVETAGMSVVFLSTSFVPGIGPIFGTLAATGVAAAGGVDAVSARRFRSDILKIVKSFICGEEIIEEKPKKGKNLKKKEATAEDSMYVCSCGMKLEKNQKFCPECGKPREDSTWRCTCGQQIENSMKFCPYCGAAREQ